MSKNSPIISKAVSLLENNDVIGLPTETVYGLAARIDKEPALRKIFEIKERPFFDPLIVHISNLDQKKLVVSEWPEIADFLAKTFWPGPLTLVLPKAKSLNALITAGLETVGIRMPNHSLAREIIEACGTPLAAPSANKFGKTSPTTAKHVQDEFGSELFVVDGGPCEVGLESTVIGLEENSNKAFLKIYRPGFVTEEKLRAALKTFKKPFEIINQESVASPGHLKTHYQPKVPLVILSENADLKTAIQKFGPQYKELLLSENPVIVARELYSQMRLLGDNAYDFIFVKRKVYHQNELWSPIWDRLTRAASLTL